MKKVIQRILAAIGGFVLVYALIIGVVLVVRGKGRVPSKTVLEVNFETALSEYVPDDPVAEILLKDRPVVRDIVEALERAGNDDRVAGLVAYFGASRFGLAQTQEVRDAVIRFRGKKKFAIAYADSFGGDIGPGTGPYYLATAFDQIYIQPSGDVQLTGILMEVPFIKGTLEKLGMRFHGDHRYEYKNALNMYTEKKFTPAHREAMEKVLNSFYAQIVKGIADGRHLKEEEVRALIDRAPYLGKEAQDAKLVDGLKYRDEIYDMAKKKAGDGAQLLYLGQYLARAGRPNNKGKVIALVYGVGAVGRGKSDYDPISGSTKMGGESVAAALRAAIEDKDVKAILFRVDSPGGSYVASDMVWREVVRARQAGKPVIVSMGDVAGSGGYFVAMAADKIVAQPGTITGSIGVLRGKILTTGGWDKLGVTWDEVHAGNNATLFAGTHDYTPAEWQRFQDWLDRVYVDFTSKVADGRKLPKEKVLQIAKGRIWSGEDAKALGLVDELGGFPTALALAKKSAQIAEGEQVNLRVYPRKKKPLERLLQREPENSEKQAVTTLLTRTLEVVQPVAQRLRAVGIGSEPGVLSMPEFQPAK